MVTVQSGWQQIGDPTTYAWDAYEFRASTDPAVLDQCNGRMEPDGTYAYHVTSTFPYIIGCYHGVPGPEVTGGGTGTGGTPTPCTTTAECDGECPAGSVGCVCATTREGMGCVPSCTTAADCPAVAGITFMCGRDGTCIPAGGP